MESRVVSLTEQLIRDLRKDRANEMPHAPKVLIVEDNQFDAELMQQTLRTVGCIPEVAIDADEAVKRLNISKSPHIPDYSIIFLDLKLPGQDGVQVLRAIRQIAPELPVIIITGNIYNSGLLSEAAKLGYFGLVEKPLDAEDVDEILDKHKIQHPPPIGHRHYAEA